MGSLMFFLDIKDWMIALSPGGAGIAKLLRAVFPNTEWNMLFLTGIRTLLYYLDQVVYALMINIYNLFIVLCNASFQGGSVIGELSKRIGLILGLVMFFYVTFDFIQILVDPDKINDKEAGPLNIIKKFIIVMVLLGTASFIFDSLHTFQRVVLSPEGGTSVIEKLILPYDINADNFGYALSSNLMREFYKITSDEEAEEAPIVEDGYDYKTCAQSAEDLYRAIEANGSLYSGFFCLNARYQTDDGSRFYIEFSPFSVVVGAFLVWMLIMYCISVGMRIIQLLFLEIISPVAFVSYLSPKKEGLFKKFWSIYFSTYIDVFIRVAIIDFVILLSGLILDLGDKGGFWESAANPEGAEKFWLSLFMILALLSFARKAPDLIKQFLPESASGLSFGINPKDRAGIGMAAGVVGTGVGITAGAIGAGTLGAIDRARMAAKLGKSGREIFGAGFSGFGSGMFRGTLGGLKNKGNFIKNIPDTIKSQHEADLSYEQLIASGGSARGRLASQVSSYFGETAGQTENRMIANANTMADFRKQARDAADEMTVVKSAKDAWEEASIGETEDPEVFKKRKQALYDAYSSYRNAAIKYALGDDSDIRSLIPEDEEWTKFNEDSTNSYELRHIKSIHANARMYSSSRNVKYYDTAGNIQTLGVGAESGSDAYKWLNGLGDMAKDNELYITNMPAHARNVANDMAAGVNDKRNFGPPGGKK